MGIGDAYAARWAACRLNSAARTGQPIACCNHGTISGRLWRAQAVQQSLPS